VEPAEREWSRGIGREARVIARDELPRYFERDFERDFERER